MVRCVLGLGVEVDGEVGRRVNADGGLRRWRCGLLGVRVWAVEDGLGTGGDIWLDLVCGASTQPEPAAVPEESTDGECEEDERADYSTGKRTLADATRALTCTGLGIDAADASA